MLFADLLSLRLVTFLMFFIPVNIMTRMLSTYKVTQQINKQDMNRHSRLFS